MLNKQNRIRKRRDFTFIYKKSKRIYNTSFTLFIFYKSKNPEFGFSVSKKVGKAVVRNKIKRRLSEIIRCRLTKIKSHRFIIQAKEPITSLSYKELEAQIDLLFTSNNLFTK